jgi:hypothetical protein
MAEPDAAGPSHISGPQPPAQKGSRSLTLAEIQRDMDRQMEPLRAARREAERSMAPVLAIARQFERDQRRLAAMVDNGIGRYLREIVGAPAQRMAPDPRPQDAADRLPTTSPPPVGPPTPSVAPAHPRVVLDASPEAMSALVERVAEAVVRRLAAPPSPEPDTKVAPAMGRRGRRRREISVGGVDAALEALAEEDQSVRALAARALVERGVPYARRTIENSDTYKAWRRDLKALRMEAAADGMADVLDAGLARIRKKKPGRGRLVDPTIDPEVEKMTKEFLRLHGEEGLDGQ